MFKIKQTIWICFVIVLVISLCGCTSNTPAQAQSPESNFTIVKCPNPECPAHNPERRPNDIDMELAPTGTSFYLCRECGAEWMD